MQGPPGLDQNNGGVHYPSNRGIMYNATGQIHSFNNNRGGPRDVMQYHHQSNSYEAQRNSQYTGRANTWSQDQRFTHGSSYPQGGKNTNRYSSSSQSYNEHNPKSFKSKTQGPEQGPSLSKGVPIDQLKRAPECIRMKNESVKDEMSSSENKVFCEITTDERKNEVPKPSRKVGTTNSGIDCVAMPHTTQIKNPQKGASMSRWQRIQSTLECEIGNFYALRNAIASYTNNNLKFEVLEKFFQTIGAEAGCTFFDNTLPKMQELVLQLPYLFPEPLPFLKQRTNMKITLSQQQAACLLANAFFCTFPPRNGRAQGGQVPDINFNTLYSDSNAPSYRKIEKLKCIINYFERVTKNMPVGTVTYARRFVQVNHDFWSKMEKKLSDLHVSTEGTIEDVGRGMLQADFANKFVGGGVLTNGLVQEEIRFVLCPEMILSRLFTEMLTHNETLIMTGCERFSDYKGYSDAFKYTQNHDDMTARDKYGRRWTEVVAMDALVFRDDYNSQFEQNNVIRELSKAYCAFKGNEAFIELPAVCTGNWGCGAFGGDKQLKALIQMMAATAADRGVCYLTFGETELCSQIGNIHQMLKEKDLSFKDILAIIQDYGKKLNSYNKTKESLFEYIEGTVSRKGKIPEITERRSAHEDKKGHNVSGKKSGQNVSEEKTGQNVHVVASGQHTNEKNSVQNVHKEQRGPNIDTEMSEQNIYEKTSGQIGIKNESELITHEKKSREHFIEKDNRQVRQKEESGKNVVQKESKNKRIIQKEEIGHANEKESEKIIQKEESAPDIEKESEQIIQKDESAPDIEKESEQIIQKEESAPDIEKESEQIIQKNQSAPVIEKESRQSIHKIESATDIEKENGKSIHKEESEQNVDNKNIDHGFPDDKSRQDFSEEKREHVHHENNRQEFHDKESGHGFSKEIKGQYNHEEQSGQDFSEGKSGQDSSEEKSGQDFSEEKSGKDSSEVKSGQDFSEEKSGQDSSEEKSGQDSSEVKSGQDSSERKSGQDSSERKSGQDSSEVKSGQDSSEVKSGQDSSERKSGQDSSERKSGQDSSEVKSGQDSSDRKSGQDSSEVKSGQDSFKERIRPYNQEEKGRQDSGKERIRQHDHQAKGGQDSGKERIRQHDREEKRGQDSSNHKREQDSYEEKTGLNFPDEKPGFFYKKDSTSDTAQHSKKKKKKNKKK